MIKRVRGAIISMHKAAYLALFIKLIRPLTLIIDYFVVRIFPIDNMTNNLQPCLMIVSPPRSGSTIIYQVLVSIIPSSYISNYHALFPRCGKYLNKNTSYYKHNLSNYYGYTSQMKGVYEGNELLDKIIEIEDINELRQKFITFIRGLGENSSLPIIFKNVRAYKYIYKLHLAVPELKFLFVERDNAKTIQSVLNAYRELGGFHPIPENMKDVSFNDPIEYSVKQILEIKRNINEQKSKISKKNVFNVTYEEFCNNTWDIVQNIAQNALYVSPDKLHKEGKNIKLKMSTVNKSKNTEENEISKLLKIYGKPH